MARYGHRGSAAGAPAPEVPICSLGIGFERLDSKSLLLEGTARYLSPVLGHTSHNNARCDATCSCFLGQVRGMFPAGHIG